MSNRVRAIQRVLATVICVFYCNSAHCGQSIASCWTTLCVAFEPIANQNDVISMLPYGRTYEQQLGRHAVLLVRRNDGTFAAFEANPSRILSGSLVAGYRRPHAFNPGTDFQPVENASAPGSYYEARITVLVNEVNADTRYLPYAATPRIGNVVVGVNSNGFVYSVLVHLGLKPPHAPWGTFGYYDALGQWRN
jgi:hypothetical protein